MRSGNSYSVEYSGYMYGPMELVSAIQVRKQSFLPCSQSAPVFEGKYRHQPNTPRSCLDDHAFAYPSPARRPVYTPAIVSARIQIVSQKSLLGPDLPLKTCVA